MFSTKGLKKNKKHEGGSTTTHRTEESDNSTARLLKEHAHHTCENYKYLFVNITVWT